MAKNISVVGVVGLPARYGGFETLVENLVRENERLDDKFQFDVYCTSKEGGRGEARYLSSRLKYLPLSANGYQSVGYDMLAMLLSIFSKRDVILVLGVSGAIFLPIVRLFSSVKIITNVDGVEWRRDKWGRFAKAFLKISERFAVKYSNIVISDNEEISKYIENEYGVESKVIAYGGDHVLVQGCGSPSDVVAPGRYAFSVCRIEPENNVHMVLEAFSSAGDIPLVMVGNWSSSDYGRGLRAQYSSFDNLILLDPVYELDKLCSLRSQMLFYVHGHSAGGTNPSLVEAMHFGHPVFAFDCGFNRATTENSACYFSNSGELVELISTFNCIDAQAVGETLKEVAVRRYTWSIVADQYFELFSMD